VRTAPASSALRDARSRSLRRHPCCRSTSSTTAAAESERIAAASAIPSTPEARARCAALLRPVRFCFKWAAEFKLLRSPLMGLWELLGSASAWWFCGTGVVIMEGEGRWVLCGLLALPASFSFGCSEFKNCG